MPTTVHLPQELLEAVDRQARDLGVSRNRFIRDALEQVVRQRTGWSSRFLEMLGDARDDVDVAVLTEKMRRTIASARTRKTPPEL